MRPKPHVPLRRTYTTISPLIRIQNGTFYREHPSSIPDTSINPPLFPGLTFTLPATSQTDVGKPIRQTQHWAVVGASDTTSFLRVLRGSLLCLPPNARTYPYLSSDEISSKDNRLRNPSRAIQYVGFNAGNSSEAAKSGVRGAYLSARYESHREETDWSVLQYLRNDTELNPDESLQDIVRDETLLSRVIKDLRMEKLVDMPVSHLSNGQTRRARIAKALLLQPELLLLDDPFMGLDPPTSVSLSPILKRLAWRSEPLLVIGLRPQDPIPDWITHLVVLGFKHSVPLMGEKEQVLFSLHRWGDLHRQVRTGNTLSREGLQGWLESMQQTFGDPLTGVGHTLTEHGIRPYNTYSRTRTADEDYFDNAFIMPHKLGAGSRERWETAKSIAPSVRTDQDWLVLTSSLPSISETAISAKTLGSSSPNGGPHHPPGASDGNVDSDYATKNLFTSRSKLIKHDSEPLIQLNSVVVKYGSKTVLGHPPPQPGFTVAGLNLSINRGTRLALLGPNGSGKTTLLSLLTSDHPQSYSLPIKFFGRARLAEKGVPGLSLWEIQSRIGHSSPEVHAFFPKGLTIRQVLESSWAETFKSKPELTPERRRRVDRFLKWWEKELKLFDSRSTSTKQHKEVANSDLSWASSSNSPTFAFFPFPIQRLLLLLRAIIKQPDIIILDEAFSGLPISLRDKALAFLEHGDRVDGSGTAQASDEEEVFLGLTDRQALIVVSHLREEIPESVNEWIRLPSEEEATEHGKTVEIGKMDVKEGKESGIRSLEGWNRVWGL